MLSAKGDPAGRHGHMSNMRNMRNMSNMSSSFCATHMRPWAVSG